MDIIPLLIVMCGIQGSGKSTKANILLENQNKIGLRKIILLSSDQYRKENPSWDNNQVFTQLYKDMNSNLSNNIDVILDATNLTYKSRRQIFNNLKVNCMKICHVMNTPISICIDRVKQRNEEKESHKVPLEVIDRYYRSFEIPFKEEGWDNVTFDTPLLSDSPSIRTYIKDKLFNYMKGFDQKCKWHLETLDEHCKMVQDYLKGSKEASKELIDAALLHDLGKLKTQKPKEKEPEEMCYYNHENIGAYDLMCCQDIFENPLDTLFYINYHMKAFDANKSEKTFKKLKDRFGEYKLNQLLLFNKADIAGCRRKEEYED